VGVCACVVMGMLNGRNISFMFVGACAIRGLEVILSTQVEASEASGAAYVWDLPVCYCKK